MKIKKNNNQNEIDKELMKRVWQSFLFTGLPALIGFAAIGISVSVGAFVLSFVGIIVLIRKEAASVQGTIRGPMAIVLGVLWIIFYWGVSAYFLWLEISIGYWHF